MGRRGSSADWGDAREMSDPRSGRGTPRDSGRHRAAGGGNNSTSGSGGRARISSGQISTALREAQQLQQDGQLEEAVAVCEELLDYGVDRPDVRYFLGWLYQESDRWEDAAEQFEFLLNDPEYALSCYYALGQCARALGQIEDAAHYFDEAVDRVNLDALTLEESDQLLQLCQEAAEAHRDMNDQEGAETIYSALLGFLRSQGWQDQVAEVERLMQETLGAAPPPPRRRKSPTRPSNMPQRGARSRAGGDPLPPMAPPAAPNPAGPPMQPAASMPGAPGMGLSGQMAALQQSAPSAGLGAELGMGLDGLGLDVGAMAGGMAGGAVIGTGMAGIIGNAAFGGMPTAAPALGGGMGALVGGGMGALGGMGAPGAGSDQLAQLINHLGGVAGIRTGLNGLPEPQRSQVGQAVRDIENYVAHGLLTAAIEECLRVMEIAPQYLDVHLLLGEIYVRQGKIDQAIAKYAILVDTYLVNGRVDDAIATYRRILQLEPNNLTYRVKLVELLNRQGRSEEVLSERMMAAESYLRLGYTDRAIQEFEQALLAHPNNMQIRLSYASALMKAGRAGQAVGEYQRVLQVDPTNLLALTQWQIALSTGVGAMPAMSMPGAGGNRAAAFEVLARLVRVLRAGRFAGFEQVATEYIQALELAPGSSDLRYALGQIQLAAGRTQEALTCFQQIASQPGMEVLAHMAAGQALLAVGDPASAAAAARELEEAAAMVRRAPPDLALWAARPRADGEEPVAAEVEVSMLLARAYQLSGQAAQAQMTLQTTGQNRAPNSEVYQQLAEVAARQTDPQAQLQEYAQLARQYRGNRQVENAVAVLHEMARLAPDDPAVHSELADIHVGRGLLDEGLTELRSLADIHTRRGQLREAALVYQRMAEIHWGTDNRTEAMGLLRQAIQFATDEMSLRQQYVQYCLVLGKVPDAVEQQTVIARYYFASRQTKEAVAALQQLIAMEKNNFEAYDLLGQTYYSVGEYEQASRVYRNLAKVDPNNTMARARLQELQAVRAQMG